MDALNQLLQTDKEFSDFSSLHGAAKAFQKYLVDDSMQLPNRNKPVFGVKNISEFMQGEYSLIWEPKEGRVSASEDLGYTWGVYTLTLANGEIEKGKYLNIWVKSNDEWKVLVDMGNMS